MDNIDARGKSCPLPIVLLAKAIKSLSVGQQVVVLADDRAFPQDLEAWCRKTGNELLSIERLEQGYFEATVRRTA
jgi:TusA-related sulfurtransferase